MWLLNEKDQKVRMSEESYNRLPPKVKAKFRNPDEERREDGAAGEPTVTKVEFKKIELDPVTLDPKVCSKEEISQKEILVSENKGLKDRIAELESQLKIISYKLKDTKKTEPIKTIPDVKPVKKGGRPKKK